MKCKNCTVEIPELEFQKDLSWRKERLAKLEAEVSELSQEIQAMEQGFCGAYCEALSEGEA